MPHLHLVYVAKEFVGTASTRSAFSRSNKYRLVMSFDRRDLIKTPWEVTPNTPQYFSCHPSPDGSRFFFFRRYYDIAGPLRSHKDLPEGVRVVNMQEGNRVRLYCDLGYFKPMKGYASTKVCLMPNGDLQVWYPKGLTTGRPGLDAQLHAEPAPKKPVLVKETIVREYK
jgi:hypothetical protein